MEGVGDADVVVQQKIGGVVFVQIEVSFNAEVSLEKIVELRRDVQILGITFTALPVQVNMLSYFEQVGEG